MTESTKRLFKIIFNRRMKQSDITGACVILLNRSVRKDKNILDFGDFLISNDTIYLDPIE
jgi:hypothetical protein